MPFAHHLHHEFCIRDRHHLYLLLAGTTFVTKMFMNLVFLIFLLVSLLHFSQSPQHQYTQTDYFLKVSFKHCASPNCSRSRYLIPSPMPYLDACSGTPQNIAISYFANLLQGNHFRNNPNLFRWLEIFFRTFFSLNLRRFLHAHRSQIYISMCIPKM